MMHDVGALLDQPFRTMEELFLDNMHILISMLLKVGSVWIKVDKKGDAENFSNWDFGTVDSLNMYCMLSFLAQSF